MLAAVHDLTYWANPLEKSERIKKHWVWFQLDSELIPTDSSEEKEEKKLYNLFGKNKKWTQRKEIAANAAIQIHFLFRN